MRQGTLDRWHFFCSGGKNYCLDIVNLDVFQTTPVIAHVAQCAVCRNSIDHCRSGLDEFGLEEIRSAVSTMESWEKAAAEDSGKVGACDDFNRPAREPSFNPKRYSINLVEDCNMRCRYCYASFGRYSGKPVSMTPETVSQCISFIQENSDLESELNIEFGGGETTLNIPLLKLFLNSLYDARQGASNTNVFLITNGLLLNQDLIHMLNRHGVEIRVSMDGDPEAHDRNRKDAKGRPTSTRVIHAIRLLSQQICAGHSSHPMVNVTCARNESPIIAYEYLMDELGVTNPVFNIVRHGNGMADPRLAHDDSSLDGFADEMSELFMRIARESSLQDLLDGAIPLNDLEGFWKTLLFRDVRKHVCQAGTGIVNITAQGALLPCEVLNPFGNEYNIGSIWSGVDQQRLNSFRRKIHTYHSKCKQCWARTLCRSGCIIDSLQGRSNMYCRFYRKLCDAALNAYVVFAGGDNFKNILDISKDNGK